MPMLTRNGRAGGCPQSRSGKKPRGERRAVSTPGETIPTWAKRTVGTTLIQIPNGAVKRTATKGGRRWTEKWRTRVRSVSSGSRETCLNGQLRLVKIPGCKETKYPSYAGGIGRTRII